MLFTKKLTLEESVIELLLGKEATAKGLLALLAKERNITHTIQALYLVLRQLTESEVIIKRGKTYFLNEEWKKTAASKLTQENALVLGKGESVSYILSSLIHHDLQWKSVVLPLHTKHPNDPIFFYNFHYIWIHLGKSREESELAYYDAFLTKKNFAFSLIGSSSVHDIEIKRRLQNEYVQWAVGVEHFSKTDYLTVFGDYIITTKLSKRTSEEISACYKNSNDADALRNGLEKIGLEKKKVKLIVEHNKDKAKKIRKRLSKEFFVPQELIKEFNLF